MTEPVRRVRVHLLAGVDLVGWEELSALVLGLSGVAGGVLGVWLSVQIGALL